MHIFSQYKGLRKENYILFLGRIVTNLGAMVWPVLTLILNQKMGMSATQVALVTICSGVLLLPAGLLGGHMADRFSKKNCIIACDLVSIVLYVICAFMPLTMVTIGLIIVAAACQSMEHPMYNALIADITKTKDRERAYSLQYLGANIGLVASPTIAGILFKNYLWLSFLICGIAISVSTLLIFLQVQDITPEKEDEEEQYYQGNHDGESLIHVLFQNKVIVLYVLILGLYHAAYQQYGYLMPIDMGRLHGDRGAVLFGSVTSLNCIVVVIFTPIFTHLFIKMSHTLKNLCGQVMLLVGYVVFLTMLGHIPAYYVAITLFTFGEIMTTIANGPYLSTRIPSSHRGRINGFMTVVQSLLQGICLYVVGMLYDHFGSVRAWGFIIAISVVAIAGSMILIVCDKKYYQEMYAQV